MRFSRMINVVGVHAAGELNEVITGGVLNVPGRTVFEKMRHLETNDDWLRLFLLQEPRGRITQCVNLVVPATDPRADVGFVIIESDYYVPMSGTNTICTVTALLETGMLPMREPVTRLVLEAPAGLVPVTAECRDGKCVSVTFDNVPAFVFGLDKAVEVPGLGTIRVDVAYGGMIYALVDAPSLGFDLVSAEGADLVAVGERIKAAAAEQVPAVHPENAAIHTINQTLFAGPLREGAGEKRARNAVVVSPGRLDRSPCGTGTSARLAVMHARGQIAVGERLVHESVLGTEFIGTVLGTASVGDLPGIHPAIT
jgi:proline racemase